MRFEFVQTHGEYARAWLAEYFRGGRWGPLRLLGGPAMIYLGWRMHVLRPGEWLAAVGSFTIGFGIYYALKPLLQVALLLRKRHKIAAQRTTVVVEVDDEGITIRSGEAETSLGWTEIVRAGWRPTYLWFEFASGARAIVPRRAIEDRDALDALLRDKKKLS
ncbi:MAG: YcxB family protein [Deltaproteobacteria bacterium]|jgi:hypothetical protein|nr:YcxB family protein [Deltaproteobacteria bacterium]MBW2536949.1 YcxB family protein [Deltaproteobacteria bacterium]